jgi:hypothetical protein
MTTLRDLVAHYHAQKEEQGQYTALCLIFSHITTNILRQERCVPFVNYDEVIVNLYRLWIWDEWAGADVYLHLLTGSLVDADDEHVHFLRLDGSEMILEKSTILDVCRDFGGVLNGLGYDKEEDDDEDDDNSTEYDDDEMEDQEEESAEEEANDENHLPTVPIYPGDHGQWGPILHGGVKNSRTKLPVSGQDLL